jgi:hypothetical protein
MVDILGFEEKIRIQIQIPDAEDAKVTQKTQKIQKKNTEIG